MFCFIAHHIGPSPTTTKKNPCTIPAFCSFSPSKTIRHLCFSRIASRRNIPQGTLRCYCSVSSTVITTLLSHTRSVPALPLSLPIAHSSLSLARIHPQHSATASVTASTNTLLQPASSSSNSQIAAVIVTSRQNNKVMKCLI